MQPLLGGPRSHLTQEQVEASLAWENSTKVRFGVDLLASDLDPTGIEIQVTKAAVSWQYRASPIPGDVPSQAVVRRQGNLTYRHKPDFNPLSVLYRLWVEMLAPALPPLWRDDFEGADGDPLDPSYTIALSGDLTEPPTLTGDGGVVTQRLNQGASIAVQDLGVADVDLEIGTLHSDQTSGWQRWILVARAQLPLAFAAEEYLASGYQLTLSDETVSTNPGVLLHRNGTQVATGPAFDQSIDYRVRMRVEGGDVKARWWPASDPEPETWQVEYTDSSPLAAGAAGFGMYKSGNRPTTALAPFIIANTVTSDDSPSWVRWHLGVFTATMPPYEYQGLSDADGAVVWRPLELADRSHFWQSDSTRDPVTVTQGTNIVQWVKDDLGVRFDERDVSGITDGGQTASQDYVFDAGTPWLELYNVLLGAVGNEPLHADVDGLPTSAPLVDPEQRPAEHDYSFGTTVLAPVTVEAVNPELPNVLRFVAKRWDGTTTEGDGIRTVVNDFTGPGSRQQRGGRTILQRVQVDAQTQTELDLQARALAPFYFAGGGLRYVGQVGLNPRHDDSDMVFLERPPLNLSGNWLVTGWDITLDTADDMRVMDLQLEHLTGAAFVSETPVPVGAFGTATFGSHAFGGPI